MKNFINWFWGNINFREWTFEGRKLNNPLLIIWRIILYPIIKVSVMFTAGLYFIAGDFSAAAEMMDEWF